MKTAEETYPDYFERYFQGEGDIIKCMKDAHQETLNFFYYIPRSKRDFRYDADKWSIKEILIHLNDYIRIAGYQALCIARNDKTPLPLFDEDHYVANAESADYDFRNLLWEFDVVGKSTIMLFENFPPHVLSRSGKSNGLDVSVLEYARQIAGHVMHHMELIKEKYLF